MGKKTPSLKIETTDDADRALQRIGQLRLHIAESESEANRQIDAIRELLVEDTAASRATLAQNEAALEAWAEEHKALFVKPRSMELNWGTVGFKLSPWKIIILGRLKVDTVIEKIRAAKMTSLIRPKFEINKEAAVNYLNSDLAKVGLRKKQSDEFFFETKEIEVK